MMNKLNFKPEVLKEVYLQLDEKSGNEMAIPSYIHKNPLIPWLVSIRMKTILRLLEAREGERILDFGCGTGMLLLQIPKDTITYYGVDLITWPARKVLEAHGRSNFWIYDTSEWLTSIAENSINSITAIEVLEHVTNIQEVINQFTKLLKPGGKLIVSGPTENYFYQIARRIAGFSGDYHLTNIYTLMSEIETMGYILEGGPTRIPFPKPFEMFIACKYVRW